MHYGKIDKNTAARRVYRVLRRRKAWIGGWDLTMAAKTTAVSTRVSEVRAQLPQGERIEVRRDKQGAWYRLVREVTT